MQPRTIAIIAAILILICSVTAFFAGLGLGFGLVGEETSGLLSEVAEAPATYEPPTRPVERGAVLLAEDFSRERWQISDDADHRKGYSDEQYFIRVQAPEYSYWSLAGERFADFTLEITTTQIEGPLDNDYGIIFRHQDDDNFYLFMISGDGFYTFQKYVEGELFYIIPWQDSGLIQQGESSNTLEVEAIGSDFAFYINGTRADTAIDAEFEQGDIGVLVGTYTEGGVEIAFDDLTVWEIDQARD